MAKIFYGFVHPEFLRTEDEEFETLWEKSPEGKRIVGVINCAGISPDGYVNTLRITDEESGFHRGNIYHIPFQSPDTSLEGFCTPNYAAEGDRVRIILNGEFSRKNQVEIIEDLEVVGFGNDTAGAYALRKRETAPDKEGEDMNTESYHQALSLGLF